MTTQPRANPTPLQAAMAEARELFAHIIGGEGSKRGRVPRGPEKALVGDLFGETPPETRRWRQDARFPVIIPKPSGVPMDSAWPHRKRRIEDDGVVRPGPERPKP